MIKLIELALKLWIRSKCSALAYLELHINSSLESLLKGNIEGLNLVASNIIFQNIPITMAEIESGPIDFEMKIGIANRNIILKENFQVCGTISLASNDLKNILFKSKWSRLGNLIEGNFFETGVLRDASIEEGYIKLVYTLGSNRNRLHKHCQVYTSMGSLTLKDKEGEAKMLLPMDPSIKFINAEIIGSKLILEGNANVKP